MKITYENLILNTVSFELNLLEFFSCNIIDTNFQNFVEKLNSRQTFNFDA